jgi:hypothetical protein
VPPESASDEKLGEARTAVLKGRRVSITEIAQKLKLKYPFLYALISCTVVLGLTQPLTQTSILRGKGGQGVGRTALPPPCAGV